MLDNEEGVGGIEAQNLACGELVVEPIHASILKVSQWIVAGRPRELVLTQHQSASSRH